MIRMIAKDLRINPLRTSLTALSMFIGIIALIAGVLVGTLGRDYLEAVNARLGGKSPTYSAIVDVPSSVNIQVVTALQERLAHFRPGIASAQYHLNDLAIWASSDDGNTEIRRVTIIITDAERTRIMPAPIIEGTWLTGADEPATLEMLVRELQSITDLPLQLDSSNKDALARALRIYNGKPIVNSVNGEQKVLDSILPLCKKYGAAVVGLALDEHGIPKTAEGRFEVAKRIVAATDAIGIPRGDVYIDCLTLTVSAEQSAAAETLKAITMCKKELGVRTVLGVSNISFGLPCRGYMNTTFLTLAMQAGLDLAIMNPNTPEMMAAVRAYRVLTSQDEKCNDYVAAYANVQVQTSQVAKTDAAAPAGGAAGADALFEAVRRGLKNEARAAAGEALKTREPLQVVNETLIPALDVVGDAFEKGSIFLPQLLQSATATQAAFEVIKTAIAASGSQGESKGRIVIATVKGDVHDIGKNIVRVILENYGYDVLDLGRDVPPERVVEAVRQTGAPLVGLSALMTTTVPNMQATIEALHAANLPCKVMVGGAVLTKAYAEQIGADFYAKDAKASADYAKQIFG